MHKITLIPGDGTGPEITEVARKCIAATGAKIKWDIQIAGETAVKKYKTPLPDATIRSIRKNRIALKGPITTPVGSGYRSVNVQLRQMFDLYANIRPCKIYPGVQTKYKNVDIVVFRENTEDLYAGIELEKGKGNTKKVVNIIEKTTKTKISPDSAIGIKKISVRNSERIVKAAFDYAKEHKRKKVTAAHKANIMKFTDGLFLHTAERVAKKYSYIEFEDIIIDNLAMQLVKNPDRYDVLVMPNLYGDIISELCAGLVGGLGLVPTANIGRGFAIFEPSHGSAPKYKGLNKVNPTAMILAGAMMLEHIGEEKAAERLEVTVAKVIRDGRHVTYDLGGEAGTREMGDAIIEALK